LCFAGTMVLEKSLMRTPSAFAVLLMCLSLSGLLRCSSASGAEPGLPPTAADGAKL